MMTDDWAWGQNEPVNEKLFELGRPNDHSVAECAVVVGHLGLSKVTDGKPRSSTKAGVPTEFE
jgi:hypothetical protein